MRQQKTSSVAGAHNLSHLRAWFFQEGVLGHKLRIKPMMGAERSEDGLKPHLLYEIEEPAQEQRLTGYGEYCLVSSTNFKTLVSRSYLWDVKIILYVRNCSCRTVARTTILEQTKL